MSLIRPFPALRPAAGRAADVIAPPYDVMNGDEARRLADGRPWSFLHISRPEIDLPPGTNPYAPEVYAKAADNLRSMREVGVLVQDPEPCYYAYRLVMGDHSQIGLVASASVAEYDRNRIRKHEFTRPDKEDDRVRQIEAVDAQTGPVLLAHPDAPEVERLLVAVTEGEADADAWSESGVRHTLWVIRSAETIAELTRRFDAMPALYIADGHHRAAAASRVSARRAATAGDAPHASFLAVIFPGRQMRILDYNRLIRDTHGFDEAGLLRRIAEDFTIEEVSAPCRPAAPGQFGMYLAGRWRRLSVRPERIPADPVGSLDVSLLQDLLLGPVLGIGDPRRDQRIDFVGGIRGLAELQRRVDSGEMAVAFALFPTGMVQLMAVADAGEVMPPKSTWFEPKLADGMASQLLA